MKLAKSLLFAFLMSMPSVIFIACDPIEETKTGVWKLVSTEIWWVPPIDGNPALAKIAAIPFGQTITRGVTGSIVETVFTGTEFNLTRTEKLNGTNSGSITYTWDQFPAYIDPGVEFNFNLESTGNLGNGIGVSNFATTIAGWPSGYGVWTQSFRNGMKTAKLTIAKPTDVTVSTKMKFVMELSSGVYHYITFYYIYEWIP